jgi:hypothetical protein
VDNTKLTWREASHFITIAITAEEDGSEEEEERGLEEGIEDAMCAVSGSGPSDQPSTIIKDLGELARHPFNPRNTPPGGCVMMAA